MILMMALTLMILAFSVLLSGLPLLGVGFFYFIIFVFIITATPLCLPKYVDFYPDKIVVRGAFTKRMIEIDRIEKVYEREARWRGGVYLVIEAVPKSGRIRNKSYPELYYAIYEIMSRLKGRLLVQRGEKALSEYSENLEGLEHVLMVG